MNDILVRNARLSDLRGLLILDNTVWKDFPATESMLRSRIEIFPEGQFVALFKDAIVGSLFTERINYNENWSQKSFTWDEVTDKGLIRETHDPKGFDLYGVGLAELPKFAQRSIPLLLMKEAAQLVRDASLRYVCLGARIPRYSEYSEAISADEYIQLRKGGRPIDPELRKYQGVGFVIRKLLPEYIIDPESKNYGVLMTTTYRRFCEVTKIKENIAVA